MEKQINERVRRRLKELNVWPIAAWKWPKVIAFVPQFPALPHADDVFYDFWAIAQQGLPALRIPYGRTDVVRNKAAKAFLESPFTHLLMLDADHQHPADIVQRLAKWIIVNPEIKVIGGLNFRRGEPYDPCCFLMGEDGRFYPPSDWESGLIEMDAVGTGSLMIAREVFEEIEPPWFFNEYNRVWEDEWPGEDMGFSKLCRAAGIKMYIDTTTTSPHMIDGAVEEHAYRQYLLDHPTTTVPIGEFKRFESR